MPVFRNQDCLSAGVRRRSAGDERSLRVSPACSKGRARSVPPSSSVGGGGCGNYFSCRTGAKAPAVCPSSRWAAVLRCLPRDAAGGRLLSPLGAPGGRDLRRLPSATRPGGGSVLQGIHRHAGRGDRRAGGLPGANNPVLSRGGGSARELPPLPCLRYGPCGGHSPRRRSALLCLSPQRTAPALMVYSAVARRAQECAGECW